MIALHFGAGKIGRGFIGAVLRRAGFDVVFADVDERIVGLINREGGYTVHVMDTVCRDEEVRGMRAVLLPEAADLIPEADLVTTAVSVKFLPGVAPVIAEGIRRRRDAWRREQSLMRTADRRPDLLAKAHISPKERKFIEEYLSQRNSSDGL